MSYRIMIMPPNKQWDDGEPLRRKRKFSRWRSVVFMTVYSPFFIVGIWFYMLASLFNWLSYQMFKAVDNLGVWATWFGMERMNKWTGIDDR